jgi:hypothetical protein
MSPEAEQVWSAANDYVNMAQKHLHPPFSNAHKALEKTTSTRMSGDAEFLMISFLLPRIAQKGFEALLALRASGWFFQSTRSFDNQVQTPESAIGYEHREAMFEAQKEVVSTFMRGLTPVQQEIIREKFFKWD